MTGGQRPGGLAGAGALTHCACAAALVFGASCKAASDGGAPGKTAPALAAAHPPQATSADPRPTPERLGLGAKVVWTAPAPAADDGSDCVGSAVDELVVSEVRADRNRLYIDAHHQAAERSERHPEGLPVAAMRVDGCAARAPRMNGRLWRGWQSPSTLTVALADLPDGEIDLTVQAFDVSASLALRKAGNVITELPLEERSNYMKIDADPARGIPAVAALIARDCKGEASPWAGAR
jgi:hypothetical protein